MYIIYKLTHIFKRIKTIDRL